jgi:hypothetical protein
LAVFFDSCGLPGLLGFLNFLVSWVLFWFFVFFVVSDSDSLPDSFLIILTLNLVVFLLKLILLSKENTLLNKHMLRQVNGEKVEMRLLYFMLKITRISSATPWRIFWVLRAALARPPQYPPPASTAGQRLAQERAQIWVSHEAARRLAPLERSRGEASSWTRRKPEVCRRPRGRNISCPAL